MANITAVKDIRSEIAQSGYSLLRADELHISDELRQSWLSLTIDYADLPADEYLPNGARYRFRRYGRFRFSPRDGALARLPHEDYFQSVEINSVTGGIIRKFAPLLDTTFGNRFLHELIRFDFAQFPIEDAVQLREDWEVHVHVIRVTADLNKRGHPTPEGIHRDGANFVTVHLAELVNARGGAVSIYDDDRRLLTTFRLETVLDSYLFDDQKLWHAADPIFPVAEKHGAIRSILTFDFHFPVAALSSASGAKP